MKEQREGAGRRQTDVSVHSQGFRPEPGASGAGGRCRRTPPRAVRPMDGRSGHLSFSSIPAPVGQPPPHLYLLCTDKEKAWELALLEMGTVRLGGR